MKAYSELTLTGNLPPQEEKPNMTADLVGHLEEVKLFNVSELPTHF